MKRVIKRMTAVMLAVTVMCGIVLGSSKQVKAMGFVAGAAAAGETISFLEALFMAGGIIVGVDALTNKSFNEDDWDFGGTGSLLDDPATQGQIDSTEKKVNEYYDNAVKDWYKNHGGSSKPTPTPMITEPPAPGVTPPVTVAPINPDDVTMPDDWATMKKNATDKGVLAMGAATAYCVKEAVKGWWDDIMDTETAISSDSNKFAYKDLVGNIKQSMLSPDGISESYDVYVYNANPSKSITINVGDYTGSSGFTEQMFSRTDSRYFNEYIIYKHSDPQYNFSRSYNNRASILIASTGHKLSTFNTSFSCYVPYTYKGESYEGDLKPLGKSSMWPSTDTRDDYNNNNSLPSPSYPNLAVPSITLPTLDEIKDLWKQGSDDEENRPTYVTNFITNHTVQPTPEPEPTKKPEVNPNPGGGTDPDPNPTPSTTPAVNPDPGGGTDPDPNPDPNPDPDPDNPDPDNPDPDNPDPTPEEEASPYKADLREIFPFCIPFDLIHLFKVFDAEPEAPVFKFPLDLELDNPWTGEKVVDYHHEFEFDFSDYEDLIKLLRIIQIVAFITGLMMITRQQMIKG